MPRVKLSLFAGLRAYTQGAASLDVDIEPGESLRQVLQRLRVPVEQARIVFVNNRLAELSQSLYGGEQIGVFPAIGGG